MTMEILFRSLIELLLNINYYNPFAHLISLYHKEMLTINDYSYITVGRKNPSKGKNIKRAPKSNLRSSIVVRS